jgi:hypothetical protein
MGAFSLTIPILTNLRPPHGSVAAPGTLKNFNTIEEFKAADKNALFNQEAQLVNHFSSSFDFFQCFAYLRFGSISSNRVIPHN